MVGGKGGVVVMMMAVGRAGPLLVYALRFIVVVAVHRTGNTLPLAAGVLEECGLLLRKATTTPRTLTREMVRRGLWSASARDPGKAPSDTISRPAC